MAREEHDEVDITELISIMNQCLKRDLGWKQYYESEMNKINEAAENRDEEIALLELERKANKFFLSGRYDEAAKVYQDIINKHCADESERGWYMQKKSSLQILYKQS